MDCLGLVLSACSAAANKDYEVFSVIEHKDDYKIAEVVKFSVNGEKIGRYQINNDKIPTLTVISESDEAEMEEYMTNSRLLIGTLGHNLFEEKISTNKAELDQEKIYFIKVARGANASRVQTSEGFAVIQGSRFADPVTNSFPPPIKN